LLWVCTDELRIASASFNPPSVFTLEVKLACGMVTENTFMGEVA